MVRVGPGLTLGEMVSAGIPAYAVCSACAERRTIDLPVLIGRVGHDYSLWNRRCRCRMTPGCIGWNKFKIGLGWADPAHDSATLERWMAKDRHDRDQGAAPLEPTPPPKERLRGPKGWLPGGPAVEPLDAIEILRAAVARSSDEPVKTREVRGALMALKPYCRSAGTLEWFWECSASPNAIGRHQNVSAALNGILRQLGLPTEEGVP